MSDHDETKPPALLPYEDCPCEQCTRLRAELKEQAAPSELKEALAKADELLRRIDEKKARYERPQNQDREEQLVRAIDDLAQKLTHAQSELTRLRAAKPPAVEPSELKEAVAEGEELRRHMYATLTALVAERKGLNRSDRVQLLEKKVAAAEDVIDAQTIAIRGLRVAAVIAALERIEFDEIEPGLKKAILQIFRDAASAGAFD